MSFRIVKINNRCKLETQLNYLVCRNDKETRILLDDISVLIIENQQVCITTALISELINHKIKVIFCDSKHNPQSELVPQHGTHNTFERIKMQLGWSEEIKRLVWANVIKQKIHNQGLLVQSLEDEKTSRLIFEYESQLVSGDETNREGLAAKAYFASLFGPNFDRRKDNVDTNIYLNYGYSMLLSTVNREISIAGYLNQIGIHHIGPDNPFNFGCDIMEPFRPFVDRAIAKGFITKNDFKKQLIDILNMEILCDDKVTILSNAIHSFAFSVFNALNSNDPTLLIKVTFLNEQL